MRLVHRSLTVLALAAAAACSPAAPPPSSTATVYEGFRLIDGNGGPAIDNAMLVVDDGRIVAAGSAAAITAPAGAAHVSLTGKTVMPALIDTHVHVAETRDAIVDQLKGKARFGVSAVMSLGTDPGDTALNLRNEIIPGAARIRSAGRGITAPEPGRTEVPYWIKTPEEGRKAVQELAANKVDIVKIWVDDRDHKYTKLSPALYTAVIDEAHKNGLRVTAHIFALDDAKGLLKAGIDAFAHSVRDRDVDEEFMAMLKDHPNLVLVPNLPDRGVAVDMAWLRGSLPDAEVDKIQAGATDRPAAQAAFGIQARNLKKMSDAGVTVALGTDGLVIWSQHVEMADMVASGMTPAQVIAAATKNAAAFLRLADAGTLEAGKSADFLVLDGNPLDDITNTRKMSAVYLRGEAVSRASAGAAP